MREGLITLVYFINFKAVFSLSRGPLAFLCYSRKTPPRIRMLCMAH